MRKNKLVMLLNRKILNKHKNKHKKIHSHKNHIKNSSLNKTIRTDRIVNIRNKQINIIIFQIYHNILPIQKYLLIILSNKMYLPP